MKSNLFSIDMKDGIRGIVMAFFTATGVALQKVLDTGALPDKAGMTTIAIAGTAAGVGYIVKNLLTNSNDKMLTPEPPKYDRIA